MTEEGNENKNESHPKYICSDRMLAYESSVISNSNVL